MNNNRDDFTKSTIEALAAMANYQCVRCSRVTRLPSQDLTKQVNIGQAAHITAASRRGPRYDDTLTSEQRRAAENGAHLCVACATWVDRDIEAFPAWRLHEWQHNAQQRLRRLAEQPIRYGTANTAEVNKQVRAFLNLCERIRLPFLGGNLESVYVSDDDLRPIFDVLSACRWQRYNGGWQPSQDWGAGDPYHVQDSHAVEIQKTALQVISQFYHAIKTGEGWYRDDNGYYHLKGATRLGFSSHINDAALKEIEAVRLLASNRVEFFHGEIQRLRTYISEPNTRTTLAW